MPFHIWVLLFGLTAVFLLVAEKLLDRILDRIFDVKIPPRVATVLVILLVLVAAALTAITGGPPPLPTPIPTPTHVAALPPTATVTATFTPIIQQAPLPAVVEMSTSADRQTVWALDTDGSVYRSTDGYGWKRTGALPETSLLPLQVHLATWDSQNILITTWQSLYFSGDSGSTWSWEAAPWQGVPLYDLAALAPTYFYAATEKGLYTINQPGLPVKVNIGPLVYASTALHLRSSVLYAAVNDFITGESRIYRLQGDTWRSWKTLGKDLVVLSLWVSEQGEVAVVLKDGRVLVEGRAALSSLRAPVRVLFLALEPLDVLVLTDGQLFRGTRDGWHSLTIRECESILALAAMANGRRWLLGCSNGLFVSEDQGLSWKKGVIER